MKAKILSADENEIQLWLDTGVATNILSMSSIDQNRILIIYS
jgi:hypothetical protein